jgi:hypothetical protein
MVLTPGQSPRFNTDNSLCSFSDPGAESAGYFLAPRLGNRKPSTLSFTNDVFRHFCFSRLASPIKNLLSQDRRFFYILTSLTVNLVCDIQPL